MDFTSVHLTICASVLVLLVCCRLWVIAPVSSFPLVHLVGLLSQKTVFLAAFLFPFNDETTSSLKSLSVSCLEYLRYLGALWSRALEVFINDLHSVACLSDVFPL